MAMGRQEIDLVVNAITKGFDKLANDLKDVDRATEQSGQSAKAGGLRFTEMASALSLAQQGFQVVAQAAEFAYKNISEGAQLELARNQFDNLAASIGTTSDSLLNKMGQATNGMMSNAEMIASASQLISLGLASNEEETVRLSKAVSTLGLDMQQVILTFANNSTARLDALGLSIEDVTTKAQELEAQGFTGDAFDEAVLIALEEKMTLLGDAADTTAGQLQKLEADWANLTDSMKQGAAQAVGPIVSDFVKMGEGGTLAAQALEAGLITQMQAFTIQSRLASGGGKDLAEEFAKMGIAIDETGQIIGTVTEDGIVKLNAMMEKGAEEATSNAEAIRAYHQAAAAAAGPNEELADKIQQTNNHLSEQEAFAAAANASMHALAGSADTAAGSFANEAVEVSQLQQLLATLPSEVSTAVDLQVYGINTLERAQQLLGSLQGFSSGPGGSDPYGGLTPGETAPAAADPFAGLSGGAIDQGSTIIQNNTFNNATDPNAVAAATAEKIGGLR